MCDTHSADPALPNSPGEDEQQRPAPYPPSIEDAEHPSQPPSPTQSVLTLPEKKDESLWYEKSCRPVILQLIQGRTMAQVQSLVESEQRLKYAILQQLKLRQMDELDKGLGFLNLEPVEGYSKQDSIYDQDAAVETLNSWSLVRSPGSLNGSQTSITSTTSQSSATISMASQVSDSHLNDVEQSAEVFLQDLAQGKRALSRIEKGSLWAKVQVKSSLKGDARGLHDAMDTAMKQLRTAQRDMGTIGFCEFHTLCP